VAGYFVPRWIEELLARYNALGPAGGWRSLTARTALLKPKLFGDTGHRVVLDQLNLRVCQRLTLKALRRRQSAQEIAAHEARPARN
jgi:hypothetical protein